MSALRPNLLVPILLLSIACTAAAAPVTVRDSDLDALRLEIAVGDPTWTETTRADGLTLAAPRLEGFVLGGEPGEPGLPSLGRWIAVPPGRRAELVIHARTWEDLAGRRVSPVPTPVRRGADEAGRPQMGAELLLPGEEPRTGARAVDDGARASKAVRVPDGVSLGEPVFWRGHRIVPLRVRPLDCDAVGVARRLLRSADVEVRFVPDKSVAPAAPGAGDDRFASLLLNGDRLSEMAPAPRPSVRAAKAAVARGTLLRPEVRVPVSKTRLHRLDADQLAASGRLDLDGVSEDQIRLYQRRWLPDGPGVYEEIEVPILMVGEGDAFADDDYFVFWGLRVRDDLPFSDADGDHLGAGDPNECFNPTSTDPVNSGNIYYLAVSEPDAGEAWARMEEIALPAAAGTPEASYRRTDYHEEDTYHGYAPYAVDGEWNYWNSSRAEQARVAFDVVHPLSGRNDARLRAGLAGLSYTGRELRLDLVAGAMTHLLGIETGVTETGRVFDSGAVLNSDLLGDNELVVDNVKSTTMFSYLDWIEVSYEAAYRALDDLLAFHGGAAAGSRSLAVTGFDTDDLALFDVTDPRRPRAVDLSAANVVDAGGTWTLSIEAAQTEPAGRRFVAVGDPAGTLPAVSSFKLSVVDGVDPTEVAADPDVLVITHPDFREQAERWAEYRSAHWPVPLEIAVVDVHTIYDWFNGGVKSPEAIRRMVAHASTEWGTWALQIFGDAYQNVRGLAEVEGQRDWVPSRWHVWKYSDYTNELLPSDAWFAVSEPGPNYPDDLIAPPEMIVARFPGNSGAEIDRMIDKTVAFEAARGGWKRRAVTLADDAWSITNTSGADLEYVSGEENFRNSEEYFASLWETIGCSTSPWCADLDLEAPRVFMGDWLDDLSPDPLVDKYRPKETFRNHCEELVLPVALAQLSAGGMVARYQGHANDIVFAHENFLQDADYHASLRQDIADMTNVGKPWVFFGFGCHVATWARDQVDSHPDELPSFGEKLLRKQDSGAAAVYASPGYEFLYINVNYSDLMAEVWTRRPPRGPGADGDRSRWVLGELTAASVAELLAGQFYYLNSRLAAQYAVLGDGLLIMDADVPRMQVLLDWEPVEEGAELKAAAADNALVVTVQAMDEAGVARLEVLDDGGAPVAAEITGGTPAGAESDQFVSWDVRLPVGLDGGDVVFHVYDTAAVGDDAPHAQFSVSLPTSVVLYLDDVLFVPGETPLPAQTPLSFSGRVVTSRWIDEGASFELVGLDALLSNVVLTRTDEHGLDMEFTAEITGGSPSLVLGIDGDTTEIPLTAEGGGDVSGIADLNAFPNPVRDEARFLFRVGGVPSPGRLAIYTVAGHRIAEVPVALGDYRSGGAVVAWDGLDDRGDRPANGVYFYRVELETTAGVVASDMQRLVMMR